jgi:hypothetical protein
MRRAPLIFSKEDINWDEFLLLKNEHQIEREASVDPRVPARTCEPLDAHAAVPASPSLPVLEVTLTGSYATAVSRPVMDITLHHREAAGQLKPSTSPIEKCDGE